MALCTSGATVISSVPELEAFLSSISTSSTLYLDLEGKCLCRHGTISLVTILIHPQKVVGLIDVLSLGKSSFTTTSKDGKSLKSILEDPSIAKFLWDLRNDADALWALYKVGLAGVIDIQLLENASRVSDKTYLWGLDKAIHSDLTLSITELTCWISSKEEIRSRMPANIFAIRPLEAKTVQYCTNDVIHLPDLHALYWGRITGDWLMKAKNESLSRVSEAQASAYKPQSATKSLGPWGAGTGKLVLSSEDLEELEHRKSEDLERELQEWAELEEERQEILERKLDELEDQSHDMDFDDGLTSCRDIINTSDYDYYYSD